MPSAEVRENGFGYLYLDLDRLPIAWLAYRGIIRSPDRETIEPRPPSFFLFDTLHRGINSTILREGKLEGYRRTHCIGQLSRLEAVFAFPSIDDAKRGIGMLGRYEPENLVEIAPLDSTYRREVYDMGWATNFDALGHDAARRYWSGETYPGEDSVSEMLLSGRFAILGTRVRTKAYETVLERDPKSVCLLEISRLAAFFGSDLGMVCPWIKGDEHGAVGYYIIRHDLEEASKVDSMIVEEIKRNPSFEINLQALKPFFLPPDDPEGEDYFRVPNVAELGPFRLEKLHLLIQTINGSAAL